MNTKLRYFSRMCPHYFFKLNSHLLPQEVNECYEEIASDYYLLLSELTGAITSNLPDNLTIGTDTAPTTKKRKAKTLLTPLSPKEEAIALLETEINFDPLYDLKSKVGSTIDDIRLLTDSASSDEDLDTVEETANLIFNIAHEAMEKIEAYKDVLLTLLGVIDDFDH